MTAFKNEKAKLSKKPKGARKVSARGGGMDLGLSRKGARKLGSVDVPDSYRARIPTGYDSMDKFLSDGGGLCPIQSITITAPRGGGKTTLWMQLLDGIRNTSIELGTPEQNGLYGSGEEFVEQLALLSERVGCHEVFADNLTKVEHYVEEIASGKWSCVVVDSLPSLTTAMRLFEGELVAEDEVTPVQWKQTRAVPKAQLENLAVQTLVAAGKSTGTVTVFILHLTKDGKVKGDSAIEHTVDTCLQIEVPTDNQIDKGLFPFGVRLITCNKNRFGGTGTVAYRLGKHGWDLKNPFDLAGTKAPENELNGGAIGGNRAARKVKEMQLIVEVLKGTSEKLTAKEVLGRVESANDTSDPSAYDRHERHLKAMVKMGKIIKSGGGKGVRTPAVYELVP